MANFDGLINIDDDSSFNSEKPESRKPVHSSDGEGDDEDDGSVMSDESGSGSGDEATTDTGIVDVSVVSPTTKETATTEATTTSEIDNQITDSTEKASDNPENFITEEPVEPIDGEETEDENMLGGGVGGGGEVTTEESTEKSPNAEARVDEKVLRVLTTEVIAAVVVGAVCAVILIAFLVYRLRKRDEGSYALSDGGYKDTYKLQGDTGKEAFV